MKTGRGGLGSAALLALGLILGLGCSPAGRPGGNRPGAGGAAGGLGGSGGGGGGGGGTSGAGGGGTGGGGAGVGGGGEAGRDGPGGADGAADAGAAGRDGGADRGFSDLAPPPDTAPGQPGRLGQLVMLRGSRSDAETIMAQALQGILAQTAPRIWIESSVSAKYVQDLRDRHGLTTEATDDAWALVTRFAGEIDGYILHDMMGQSPEVASALAGVLRAIPVDTAGEPRAQAAGLKMVLDVRGRDGRWALAQYGARFTRGLFVEIAPTKRKYLRDIAASRKAFLYFDTPTSTFRTDVAKALGPNALCLGWGEGEHGWVTGLSAGSAAGIPADYNTNLSVLSYATEPDLTQKTHQPTPDDVDGVHYVAFVMTDGDNIQWVQRAFVDDVRWFGSPERGKFPMSWEMAPVLAELAPSYLRYLQLAATNTATVKDFFVAGPSGLGYMFPSRYPDLRGYLERMGPAVARADLRIVTVLDDGPGMAICDAFLDRPEVDAVIYKDFADYNQRQGAIRWRAGKPCIAHRYLLWDNGGTSDSPAGVAASLAMRPRAPRTDPQSFSLVNVHAWSMWGGAGAMSAAAQTVAMLPPQVKVVTAEHVIRLLRKYHGTPLP